MGTQRQVARLKIGTRSPWALYLTHFSSLPLSRQSKNLGLSQFILLYILDASWDCMSQKFPQNRQHSSISRSPQMHAFRYLTIPSQSYPVILNESSVLPTKSSIPKHSRIGSASGAPGRTTHVLLVATRNAGEFPFLLLRLHLCELTQEVKALFGWQFGGRFSLFRDFIVTYFYLVINAFNDKINRFIALRSGCLNK